MRGETKWAVIVGEKYVCQPGTKKLGWTYDRRWADFVASLTGGNVIDVALFLAAEDLPSQQVMASAGTLGDPGGLVPDYLNPKD